MNVELQFPATPDNASQHAALAVELALREFDLPLDYSPASLEALDGQIDWMREQGLSGEDVAESLFALGCYMGEVLVRGLGGRWIPTLSSRLRGVSPWSIVVLLPGGATWDPIGKTFKRLELGDSEFLPAFFAEAVASLQRPAG